MRLEPVMEIDSNKKTNKVTSEDSKYDSLNSKLSITLITLAQLKTTESWLSSSAIL